MRINLKDKNISFADFKKKASKLFVNYADSAKERALIMHYELATGKKYEPDKRVSKKSKPVGKKLAGDKEPGS